VRLSGRSLCGGPYSTRIASRPEPPSRTSRPPVAASDTSIVSIGARVGAVIRSLSRLTGDSLHALDTDDVVPAVRSCPLAS
jgi:hypothetical protein